MTPEILAALTAGLAAWWLVPDTRLHRLRAPAPAAPGAAWAARGRALIRSALRRGRAREAALQASVAQACDLLAVCLDAGRPPRAALRVVAAELGGPVGEEFTSVLQRIDLGMAESQAWATLGGVPGYREVARDAARSVRSGLGLAAALREHARDQRRTAHARALVAARSAGVKGVLPLMLCFLPAFVCLGVVPVFGAVIGRLFS